MRCSGWLFLLALLSAGSARAQAVIAEDRLKDFPSDPAWMYPYESFGREGWEYYIEHDPVLRLSDGEFLYLWRKRFSWRGDLSIRRSNLFLETIWEQDVELAEEEHVLHVLRTDSLAVLVTHTYEMLRQQHTVRARGFSLASGAPQEPVILWAMQGRSDQEAICEPAPDGNGFMLYSLLPEQPEDRVTLYSDYIRPDGRLGVRASRAGGLRYVRYDSTLNRISDGQFSLPWKKATFLGCHADAGGRLYAAWYEARRRLHVMQVQPGGQTRTLTYDAYPKPQQWTDGYLTQFPPLVGRHEQVYLSIAERLNGGRLRGQQAFQVLAFDFQRETVDLSRRIDVSSTLRVAVAQAREAYGLKPRFSFDHYYLHGQYELADGRLWLAVQAVHRELAAQLPPGNVADRPSQRNEELIFFEFGPDGSPGRTLIIPTHQIVELPAERMGMYYSLALDPVSGQGRLITREPADDKLRGPERIFLRRIDLNQGTIGDRKLLYEGKRRSQFVLNAYTEWLNPDLLTLTMLDGDMLDAILLTLNLSAEPEPESENRRRR
ncbi:MAG: hypothetical protein NW241_03090 [Bacteroidia bacterium]|nr:hypothetical protein [Bacteroidia bacterium]